MKKEMPYFAQWESPELVEKILKGDLSAKDDPNWQTSGATDLDEYELWSWNACGMACLKMLLAKKSAQETPIIHLAKRCLAYDGYRFEDDEIAGMFYYPFVQFIYEEFGLEACVAAPLSIVDIPAAIDTGACVMASVSPQIRDPEARPDYKGGHLILIFEHASETNEFIYHNPSGHKPETQTYARISAVNFDHYFAGRGIIINAIA